MTVEVSTVDEDGTSSERSGGRRGSVRGVRVQGVPRIVHDGLQEVAVRTVVGKYQHGVQWYELDELSPDPPTNPV
jgi:hypothetical protein